MGFIRDHWPSGVPGYALTLWIIVFVLTFVGSTLQGTGIPGISGFGTWLLNTAALVTIVYGIILIIATALWYTVYDLEQRGKGRGPASGPDGYESTIHYECENCGTVLRDEMDINQRGGRNYCGNCGHELNNQDGADSVRL